MSDSEDSQSSKDWPVTEQIIKGRKQAKCSDCCFDQWQPGDTCWIIEHRHYREHVCPACMIIKRGYPISSYHRQNQKVPSNEREEVEKHAAQNDAQESLNQEADKVKELWRRGDYQAVQQLLDEKTLAFEDDEEKEEEAINNKEDDDEEEKATAKPETDKNRNGDEVKQASSTKKQKTEE